MTDNNAAVAELCYADLETDRNLTSTARMRIFAKSKLPLQRLVFAQNLGESEYPDFSMTEVENCLKDSEP